MLLDDMFSERIRTDERPITAMDRMPFPEEEALMIGAVARRRDEFATGRACARTAMELLGLPAMPLAMRPDRAPVWPGGIVGSISHSRSYCAAAAALRCDGFLALGLDIEEAEPLDDTLLPDLCTSQEQGWLGEQPSRYRGLLLKAFFSAKECAYKCQYSITGAMLDFHALIIDMDIGEELFAARFQRDAPPFKCGNRLTGRIRVRDAHIVSTMSIGVDEWSGLLLSSPRPADDLPREQHCQWKHR